MSPTVNLAPIWLTLKVAVSATLLAGLIGVGLAWLVSRRAFRGRDSLDALLTLPLVLPPTVLGYYLIVVLGRHGWIGGWLKETAGISLIFTWQGAVAAAAVACFPLLFKSARAAFESVDRRLEDAARSLGRSEAEVAFRVTLPLARRGIAAGALLAFARAMGEFGATLMVAGNLPGKTQTLAAAVYEAVQAGESFQANLLVAVTTGLGLLVLYGSGKLLQNPVSAH
jgi:molybdate transport system permease protein